jgi:hypothetical protein
LTFFDQYSTFKIAVSQEGRFMRLKKTWLSLAGLVLAGLLLSGCATQSSQSVTLQQQKQPAKPAKRYLFLVSSGYAHLHKISTSQYALKMDLPAINQVVAFTDRPYREAQFISAKQLQALWAKGANSFAKDHPNAVLSSKNLPPIIVEVYAVQVRTNDITLIMRPLSQQMKKMEMLHKVALTIDGAEQGALVK